jgi:MFS family permease
MQPSAARARAVACAHAEDRDLTTPRASPARIFFSVFENRDLRHVLVAYAVFNAAEWGCWVAMLVYAFGVGGAAAAGLVAVIQLVPAIIVAPLGSILGDRLRRERALALGYLVQSAAMGAVAAALFVDAPVGVVYGFAALSASAQTLTRPVHNALLPALANTPEELTAANAASSTVEGLAVFAGPIATGIVLALSGPASVFAMFAVAACGGSLLARTISPVEADPGVREGALREAVAGMGELRRERGAAVLLALVGAQFVVLGLLDVLVVVLAFEVLGMGVSGPATLSAAAGIGSVVGAGATVVLIGRRRLSPGLVVGAAVTGAPLMLVALAQGVPAAISLLVLSGVGKAFVDVSGRTLLQRTVNDDVLSRVFGVQESIMMLGLTIGSAVAPVLVAAYGARGAFVVGGAFLPVLAVCALPVVARLDARGTPHAAELQVLRSISFLRLLAPPVLERLAGNAIRLEATRGSVVIRRGDLGDRFYVLVDGSAEVTGRGPAVPLGPGDFFGEIALLRDVPRTATVTLTSDSTLLALERNDFLEAVAGSRPTSLAADREIDRRLAELD